MLLQQQWVLTLHCTRLLPMLGSCSQEAKAAAKKAKVEKATVRQQAAAAEAKPAGSSKKAKAKAEADEKRVCYCPAAAAAHQRVLYALLACVLWATCASYVQATNRCLASCPGLFTAAKALEHPLCGQRPV